MKHDFSSADITALDICESLLLALAANKVLPLDQILSILTDVAALQADAPRSEAYAAMHIRIVERLEVLIASTEAVKH